MLGQRAVTRPAIAPGVRGDPAAVVEHLDGVSRCPRVHLLAKQGMRHRVKEALDLDMIVYADAGEAGQGSARAARGMPDEGRRHSANSKSSSGKACIIGRSIASNNWRRLIPRRRISRLFIRSTATAMAVLHSASEKKVTLRNRPRM